MPEPSIIIPAYNAEGYISISISTTFESMLWLSPATSGRPNASRDRAKCKSYGVFIFIFDSDDVMLLYNVGEARHAFWRILKKHMDIPLFYFSLRILATRALSQLKQFKSMTSS